MNRRTITVCVAAAGISTVLVMAGLFQTVRVQTAGGRSCESVAALTLPNTTVTSAQTVGAGAFTPPAAGRGRGNGLPANPYARLPAFCRVAATSRPSSDSDIKIEVWLPASGWNGKFQAVGNGGWAGTISYPALAAAVAAGYAGASTDTGHVATSANDGSWALGHMDRVINYGQRGVHQMALASKAIRAGNLRAARAAVIRL